MTLARYTLGDPGWEADQRLSLHVLAHMPNPSPPGWSASWADVVVTDTGDEPPLLVVDRARSRGFARIGVVIDDCTAVVYQDASRPWLPPTGHIMTVALDRPSPVIDLAASAIAGLDGWQLDRLLAVDPARERYERDGVLPADYVPLPPSTLEIVDEAAPGLVHRLRISEPEGITWPV